MVLRHNAAACLFAFGLSVVVGVGFPAHAEWAGKMTTQDGHTVVKNPATGAMSGLSATPELMWEIGEDDDHLVGIIADIQADAKGNIYMLDSQLAEVSIYSPDGELIRTIGHQGQGPGEFEQPVSLFVFPDGKVGVLQPMPGKIVLLTSEGDAAGEYALPEGKDGGKPMLFGGSRSGDQVVIATHEMAFNDGGITLVKKLLRVAGSGKETALYHSESQKQKGGAVFISSDGEYLWTAGNDGRVYVNDNRDEYRITVYQPDGTLDRVIERDFKRVKRTAEQLAEAAAFAENMPHAPDLGDYAPALQNMYTRADGTLWVMSSSGTLDMGEGAMGRFDVFDKEGRFIKEVTIACDHTYGDDAIQFANDRLFVITGIRGIRISIGGGGGGSPASDHDHDDEDENEPSSVLCYQLES